MSEQQKKQGVGVISCVEIREQLPAYMLRELGEKQSRLMHEHIRLCEDCRREAAQFEQMAALLRDQVGHVSEPTALSERRMARLRFAAMHPVFDWIYYQHRFVSSACAVFLILLVLLLLRNFALFREPALDDSIPIWRMFRSGRLPELVDEAARQYEAREGGGSGLVGAPEEGAP